jgi:hypothetical protein
MSPSRVKQAECEAVANNIPLTQANDRMTEDDDSTNNKKSVEIRGDHIAKIAAELLMDYS